ncbi:helix-turn-helix transcriptional regulator [Halofilum ochraceum]|uniref:helix-turn-helix transcriptional regulator n=1 Tax=Halofilum ochraceum TaxID=1611323 RepID=UPI001C2F5EA5|nr:AlpA family phage regulatory protein [Halofilum ochraceum]
MADEITQLKNELQRAVKTVQDINAQLESMCRNCEQYRQEIHQLEHARQPYQFLRAREVARRFDASIPTIYRWVSEGVLPGPHKLSKNTSRWLESEIEAAAMRITEPGEKSKPG